MEIAAVKLRNSYQIEYIKTNNIFIKNNSLCLIETDSGVDIGTILKSSNYKNNPDLKVTGTLLRKTEEEDLEQISELEKIEEQAFTACKAFVKKNQLKMKLVGVKALFDTTKIVFYFTADNRVDFRELVKELAAIFKKRIEMRQIGVRDEARLVGGYGLCGRKLCCGHKKNDYDPVSIKMAKEQNLNLNTSKISGMCGRLLCCLEYEYEVYKEKNKNLPRVGDEVFDDDKNFVVISVDSLQGQIRIKDFQDSQISEISEKDLKICKGRYCLKSMTSHDFPESAPVHKPVHKKEESKKLPREDKKAEDKKVPPPAPPVSDNEKTNSDKTEEKKKPSYDIFQPRKKRS